MKTLLGRPGIRSILALAAAAILLSGCILQSRTPIYDDRQSKLVLGMHGGRARTSTWTDGKLIRDAETFKIRVVGKHYEATTQSSTVALHFVPLQASWYVLQATGQGQPPAYLLARISEGMADTYPLACRDLKQDSKLLAWIDFEGDDCFIKTGAPVKRLLSDLLKSPGEPSSRLEIQQ